MPSELFADLLAFAISLAIILFSYLLTNFIASRIKSRIIRFIYEKSATFESRGFIFKLCIQSIAPVSFIIVSFITAFLIPTLVKDVHFKMLENIPFTITVSTASLGVKIGLIWLIYRIASLSSVNKVLNKFVAYILLISSFINFLDFNRYLVNFLGRFKANFGSFEVSIYKAFLFFVVIMAVFWFNKVIIESIKKILDTTTVNTNVKALFVKILSICLFIIIFLMGLGAIGFDIKSLTIFGSALAVGLGFGLQKLVSNFISGITISFEEIIKEGDIISIDDKREIKGIVKSLNMRYLLLCEFDGKEVMIPNDTIITSNIANLTHSNNNLRIRIDLRVPHDIDLETFQKDVLKLMRKNVYSSKFEESMFHVESVSESGINIFLHFWIDDPMEINASRTSIMFELISFLKERNIQIPPIVTKLTIDKIGIPV